MKNILIEMKILTVVLYAAIILSLDGCIKTSNGKNEVRVFRIESCDTSIVVGKGDKIQVILESQISTGYSWILANQSSNLVKGEVEPIMINPDEKDRMPGSPEKELFNYVAGNKLGTDVLLFNYERSFEKGKPPLKTCKITITFN